MLADTSVWVAFLRDGTRGSAAELDRLLEQREVLICGPVAAELVAGAGDDGGRLWSLLAGLAWAELQREAWRQVGETAAALRRRGATVALTDVEIAVAAMRAGAAVWSQDSDFERIGTVLPELRRFRKPA